MEVSFAPTFYKSIKKLIMHQTWWYKMYKTIRYDIPRFFKNIWKFRKELYDFHSWDFSYNLKIFQRSLILTANYLEEHGYEEDISRNKKIAKIRRAIELIENCCKDNYIDLAEKELGIEVIMHPWKFEKIDEELSKLVDQESAEEKASNKKIFDRSTEIENEQWFELWQIFKGQDLNEFNKLSKKHPKDNYLWEKWYDGSGAKGWWD